MQTHIHPDLAHLSQVQEADGILRKCVHCGFCTATCPTYQLLGDELDGPRGRIYLIKNLLEQNATDEKSVAHLDRCLTCRACETTCPSGVAYGRLLDIGRELVSEKVRRPAAWRLVAGLIRTVVPRRNLFGPLLRLGQPFRRWMPRALADRMPMITPVRHGAQQASDPSVLILTGCVQHVATPNVNASLQKILARQGQTSALVDEGCCGALDYHLSAHEAGKARMRRVIELLSGRAGNVQHIVSSATGCGVTIREYPEILGDEPLWREKAEQLVSRVADPVELVSVELGNILAGRRIVVHTPCSMQHGMKMNGRIEKLLAALGADILPAAEPHLCCGSAGTYSLMQPSLSGQLQSRKVAALEAPGPDVIVTANVGCQLHLATASRLPVMHWLELIADAL